MMPVADYLIIATKNKMHLRNNLFKLLESSRRRCHLLARQFAGVFNINQRACTLV